MEENEERYPAVNEGLPWLESTLEPRDYLHIAYRHKFLIAGIFVLAVLATLYYNFSQTPLYKARATILIEPDSPTMRQFTAAPIESKRDYYETQFELATSQHVLEKAVEMGGFESHPVYQGAENPARRLKRLIKVEGVRDTRLMAIEAVEVDPELAAREANIVAEAFVRYNLEGMRSASQDAFSWLSEQMAVLKKKVESSELELLEYQEQENIVSIDRRQELTEEKLSELNEQYTRVSTDRIQLESRIKEIEELLQDDDWTAVFPKQLSNQMTESLRIEYNKLSMEMARLSSEYKPKHPKLVALRAQMENVRQSMAQELEKSIEELRLEYRIALRQEEKLSARLDSLKHEAMQLARNAVEFGVLKREAESNKKMLNVLLEKMKETDLGGRVTLNNIRMVDRATAASKPFKPQKGRNLLLGSLLGLFLGLGMAFVVEYLDNSLKNEDDVQLYLNLPLLGMVPSDKSYRPEEDQQSEMMSRAYRDLKTVLTFYGKEHILKTLLVASSVKGEGKTTSVISLGRAFAQSGSRVLLIDADLFHPRLAKSLGVDPEVGLTDYFLYDTDVSKIVFETSTPNLSLIPGGLIPPAPEEIIGSEGLQELIDSLRDDYDIILIDSPPLNLVLEVSVLASAVDGVALAVRYASTSRNVVRDMLKRLRQSRANVLGVTLTLATLSRTDASSYYYYNYYREGEKSQA